MKDNVKLFFSLPIFILSSSVVTGTRADAAVCPAYGYDTDCTTLITITNSSTYPSSTGQPPYDGDDDNLVGVVNQSLLPISSLSLTGDNIFGFDGDGITTYGAPGNAQDPTGYGGPNAYFTNINTSSGITSGNVNFITPIAPGGTGYFSLELAPNLPSLAGDILNNSVSTPTIETGLFPNPNRPSITATFTPQNGLTIAQAAAALGFKNFDWEQVITNDPVGDLTSNSAPNTPLKAPYFDPPPGGYTNYNTIEGLKGWNSYPYYWDINTNGEGYSLDKHIKGNILNFEDSPEDSSLPNGQALAFTTDLVGVLPDNSLQPLGLEFSWTDTWNGTSGEISRATVLPLGTGTTIASGTGGITITGQTETTTYNYTGGLTIDAINNIANGPTFGDHLVTTPEPSNVLGVTISIAFLGSASSMLKKRKKKFR